MDSSFGARLKAQRESRHVVLETIAGRTKIRLALLEGLERDDVSQWPGGIFRRSYLRSYAAAIGLDPESTVREFLALYPDPVEEPEMSVAAGDEPERAGRRPPMRLHYLIASAMGALPQAFSSKSRNAAADSVATPQPDIEASLSGLAVGAGSGDITVPQPGADPALTAANPVPEDEPYCSLDEEFFLADVVDGADVVGVDAPNHVDLPAMAGLCTRVAEATCTADLERVLEEASRVLHAVGLIVWLWNPGRAVLWPALSHGYSPETLARLPALARDVDNPIGAAFRSAACQVVGGGHSATSAIVVPVMSPGGCGGVLAVECSSGLEQDMARQALAAILAAQLSLLVHAEPVARTAIA